MSDLRMNNLGGARPRIPRIPRLSGAYQGPAAVGQQPHQHQHQPHQPPPPAHASAHRQQAGAAATAAVSAVPKFAFGIPTMSPDAPAFIPLSAATSTTPPFPIPPPTSGPPPPPTSSLALPPLHSQPPFPPALSKPPPRLPLSRPPPTGPPPSLPRMTSSNRSTSFTAHSTSSPSPSSVGPLRRQRAAQAVRDRLGMGLTASRRSIQQRLGSRQAGVEEQDLLLHQGHPGGRSLRNRVGASATAPSLLLHHSNGNSSAPSPSAPPPPPARLIECYQEFDVDLMERRAVRFSDELEDFKRRAERFEEEVAPELVQPRVAERKNLRFHRFRDDEEDEEEEVDHNSAEGDGGQDLLGEAQMAGLSLT